MDKGPFERVLDARLIMSVIASGIMSFSGVVVETAMNITFPTLMEEFGIGTSTVQWLTTAYLLMLAFVIPTSAWMGKRFRTKHIFVVAMCCYITGIVLGMTAQSFPMLLAGRITEGIGTGIALPLMFNIITEQAPKRYMGTMMGIGSLITAMAPAVGPSVGGYLVENYSWRMVFACLLPFLAVAFAMGVLSIRQSHEVGPEPFDVRGWLCLVAGFTCLVFATSAAGTRGWISPAVLGLLAGFVAMMALFVRHAQRAAEPLISTDVFRSAGFDLSLVSLMILQFTVLGLSYLLPNYAQLVMGAGATEAGSILLPGCMLGAARPILAGCVCTLVACVLYYLMSASLPTHTATLVYMLFTLGQGLLVGNTLTHALSMLAPRLKADGNAVVNTLQQLSGAVGTSVVSSIVNTAQTGMTDVTMAYATILGTRGAYLLLAVLMAVPFVCQMFVFAHKQAQGWQI